MIDDIVESAEEVTLVPEVLDETSSEEIVAELEEQAEIEEEETAEAVQEASE